MTEKDFDSWNKKKKYINSRKTKFYHLRDIWWTSLGINIGIEIDGKGSNYERPVLIIKKFGPDMCFVVPLTTAGNESFYRISIGIIDRKETYAAISQIRLIDAKRFTNKITMLDKVTFEVIKKAVRNLF
ncbi:MAG: type II toxin-antitoxin system PemK/MazF family toxin [Candidatus Paceibacterota bacterium]